MTRTPLGIPREVKVPTPMPRRPSQHRAETRSRIAFERGLPSTWLFRNATNDYGVDGEVEIFNDDNATGLKFYVQLKATSKRTTPILTIATTTWNYYRALDLPVLLVVYCSSSDTMYAEWQYNLDPFYATRARDGFRFRLDSSAQWTAATPRALESAVRAYRAIRSPMLNLPLPLLVDLPDTDEVHGSHSTRVRIALRALLADCEDVLTWAANGPKSQEIDEPYVRVSVSENSIAATPSGDGGMTLHFNEEYTPTTKSLASDIVVGAALALARTGHAAPATKLLRLAWSNSAWADTLDATVLAAHAFARVNAAGEGLVLFAPHLNNAATASDAQLLLTPFLAKRKLLGASDLALAAHLLSDAAEHARRRCDLDLAARLVYSAGNIQRRAQDLPSAKRCYEEAARLDEAYLKRDYYNRELAGVFFELCEYREAAALYGRALDLGDDRPQTAALRADALYFSGEFAAAAELWDAAIPLLTSWDQASEWRLKQFAVTVVVSRLGTGARGAADAEPQPELRRKAPSDSVEADALGVIQVDPLNADAWFRLGVHAADLGDQATALGCWTVAATVRPEEIAAWHNAILFAVASGAYEVLLDLLYNAHRHHGDALLQEFASHTNIPVDMSAPLAEILAGMPTAEPEPYTLRIHGEDSWMEVDWPTGR